MINRNLKPQDNLSTLADKIGIALQKPPEPKKKLDVFFSHIEESRKLIVNLFIVVIGVFLIAYAYKEITTTTIVIEPFEVPLDLQKNGLSGKVFAEKLYSKLDLIKKNATLPSFNLKSISESGNGFIPYKLNYEGSEIDVEVHGTDISMHTAIAAIRDFFHINNIKITGQVFNINKKLYISTRITDHPTNTFLIDTNKIDSGLYRAAVTIEQYTEPLVLLQSLLNSNNNLQDYEHSDIFSFPKILSENHDKKVISKIYVAWGVYLNQTGQYQKAREVYLNAITFDPDNPNAYLFLAENEQFNYNLNDAFRYYEASLKLEENEANLCGYGLALLEKKDTVAAETQLKKALSKFPNSAQVHKYIGDLYAMQGKKHDAETEYLQSIKINPSFANSYFEFAKIKLDSNKKNEADDIFQRILSISPAKSKMYSLWGSVWFAKMKYDSAAFYYRKAIAEDDTYGKAHYNLGMCLGKTPIDSPRFKADIAEANVHFTKAHTLLPHVSDIYNSWGSIYSRTDAQKALEKFEEGFRMDTCNRICYTNLINAYGSVDRQIKGGIDTRMKRSTRIFGSAVKRWPEYAKSYYQYAYAWSRQLAYDSALHYIRKAINLEPYNTNYRDRLIDYYEAKANVYFTNGDLARARTVYCEAFICFPLNIKLKEKEDDVRYYSNMKLDSPFFKNKPLLAFRY